MALGCSCFASAGRAGGFPIVINEFLASNSGGGGTDLQGQADDWIELYNPWDTSFDVGGMYLTDNLSKPTKWRIPLGRSAETTIGPHGYLLIWADGDLGDAGLHAGFSLDSSGEDVALFAADGGTLIDELNYGQQTPNVSYGRFPDGGDTWIAMTTPTPGKRNVQPAQSTVAEPVFSIGHGFYDQEIFVAITCPTPGAIIYYTTNGGEPYSVDLGRPRAGAAVYTSPVRIDKTACLRAVAIRSGWRPSTIQTQTYVFLADVVRQSPMGAAPGAGWPASRVNGQVIDYGMDPDVVNDPRYKDLIDGALLAIPSISLVTDLANLFDSRTGIYVNPYSQGQTWERPVSVELIDPNGAEGFQIDAGLRIRGGYSRSTENPKHAFRLFFRADYGASKLKYPLFGNEGADEFENVDLRTSQNYSWSFEGGNANSHDTFVREVFSRDTQRDMGRPYTRSRYYHLYLDGQYWGLYQTQERSEADYAETYFGPDKDDYDVVKSRAGNGGYDIEATDGTLDAWRALWEAAGTGFNDDSTCYRVQGLDPDGTPNPSYPRLLDVDNLIDYMLCTYYVGDPDGPVSAWARVANNFYAIYNRVEPDGFKFFRHDAEHSLYDLYESRLFAATTVAVGALFNQSNPLWMHTHLMLHPEYRMRFVDRVYQCFFNDGVLTPPRCSDRFMARADQIDLAIIGESARWGDAKRAMPRTRDDDWRPDIDGMIADYFPLRTGVVLDQFRSQGWYPSFDPPTCNHTGGRVPVGFALTMQSPYEIYYTLDGSDPRLSEKAGNIMRSRVLVAESDAKRVLVPKADIGDDWKGGGTFDDSSWRLVSGGPGGVGYERETGYESFISLNVGAEMYGAAAGCYLRVPFTVSGDPNDYTFLTLKVLYDDGFVAYLNGVEMCRAGCSGTPRWDSTADASHEADAVEPFLTDRHVGVLRSGQNILAVHVLNVSTTSSDLLIHFSLEGAERSPMPGGAVSPAAFRYTGPVTLDRSVCVKARARSGAVWSALSEAAFTVGPAAQSLP
jgi:hypothetical protein